MGERLWCQGPIRGWRVWNRGPGLFKGVVLSSLEVLGAGTKKKGASVSLHLKERTGKESRRDEELTKKESTSDKV